MKERSGDLEAGATAAAWMLARLAFPPEGHNTHTLMYPLVEAAGGYNTLEPFHALYMPVVSGVRRLWELCGASAPALPALQAVSLLAGTANILLLHRAVRRATGNANAALGAALIMTASANLWSWSLMTTSYTLSTSCLLAAVVRLLSAERLGARDAAWTGLWLGLAAGFDTAAGVAALVAAYELWRRRAPSARPAAMAGAFAGAFALPMLAGLVDLVLRLRGLGWPFPPTLAGFLASLPGDIVPLWQSRDLIGQVRGWDASTAPLDLPLWAAAAVVLWSAGAAKSWSERALWRMSAGLWALISVFFFLNDPHNRFLYAAGLLLPGLFALGVSRVKRPLVLCAAAATVLGVWHAVEPPLYTFGDNPGFAEASFLRARLEPEDMIVALSEPDWVFSYAFGSRARVVILERAAGARRSFGAETAAPGEELEGKIDEALCSGRRVIFAADAHFRSSVRDPAELDAEAGQAYARMSKRFIVQPAWVSPRGQHYLPLRPRRCLGSP